MFGIRRRMWLGVGGSLVWLAGQPACGGGAESVPILARRASARGARRRAFDARTLDAALTGCARFPSVLEADAASPKDS